MRMIANGAGATLPIQDTTEYGLGETRFNGAEPQPFALLIVTTHPESAEEGAGDVVRVPAEFGERSVLIDLTEVTRIDSWGLALFIEAMQRITALGGSLVIFGIRENVLRVFETAKLDQVFRICSTREEAMATHHAHWRPSPGESMLAASAI